MTDPYDALETRSADERASDLAAALPEQIARAKEKSPGMAEHLAGVDPASVKDRAALAELPVLRKSEMAERQRKNPPFGGLTTTGVAGLRHVFQSPGPIYEPAAPIMTGGGWAGRCTRRGSARATSSRTASPTTSPRPE